MGGSKRKAFVPGRSRRHHGSNKFDRARRNADLHAAAYRRLGRSDLLGGRPMVGELLFSIEPQNGIDKPQMDILEGHLGSLNHAPVVTVANHCLKINHWSSVKSWISLSDADGDAATQYQFWWGDPSASAAKFWTPAGNQPALNTLTVSAADVAMDNVWLGGATAAGSET